MRIVGLAPVKHNCYDYLPRAKWWKKFPEGITENTVAECDCGKRYIYRYHGYAEVWGWDHYDGGAVFYG